MILDHLLLASSSVCRNRPATTSLSVLPLLLILVIRQLNGFYGADAKAAWTWVAQYLFPPLTLIAGAWSVTASPGDRSKMSSPVIFWGAVFLSLFYIVVLYLVIGAQAGGEQTWQAVFEQSGLFLSLFEAFIIGWLGKLFIEIKR